MHLHQLTLVIQSVEYMVHVLFAVSIPLNKSFLTLHQTVFLHPLGKESTHWVVFNWANLYLSSYNKYEDKVISLFLSWLRFFNWVPMKKYARIYVLSLFGITSFGFNYIMSKSKDKNKNKNVVKKRIHLIHQNFYIRRTSTYLIETL